MKTIKDLKRLIKENEKRVESIPSMAGSSLWKKVNKENEILRGFISFLEKGHDLSYFKKEKKQLEDKIERRVKGFEVWKANNPMPNASRSKVSSVFRKEMGLDKLKFQLKWINFIISI